MREAQTASEGVGERKKNNTRKWVCETEGAERAREVIGHLKKNWLQEDTTAGRSRAEELEEISLELYG